MAATGTPWFRLYSQLRNHPKLDDLADALGVPKVQALGHLVALWCYACDYTPDGNLSETKPSRIARESMWTGDPQVFLDALIASKLVDDQTLIIHNSERYSESYRRAKNKKMERVRAKKKTKRVEKLKQKLALTEAQPVPRQSHDSSGTVAPIGDEMERIKIDEMKRDDGPPVDNSVDNHNASRLGDVTWPTFREQLLVEVGHVFAEVDTLGEEQAAYSHVEIATALALTKARSENTLYALNVIKRIREFALREAQRELNQKRPKRAG